MKLLFLDTETFSEVNLKTSGAAKYARGPSTECLMITWGYDTGIVRIADLTETRFPESLQLQLTDPEYMKIAHNMPFDRAILKHTQGIDIPIEQCMDSQLLAFSLGFTGTMGAMQEAIGFSEDVAKIKEGRKLILRFCKLQPKNHTVSRWTRLNDPDGWERFKQYGTRDTESMREMWKWMIGYNSLSEKEWHWWRVTQLMNERGLPVDTALVDRAISMSAARKAEIKSEMKDITGVDNPNSAMQLQPWLQERGVHIPNMQAATIDAWIPTLQEGSETRKVLQMKRTFGQTAVTKWASIKKMVCDDDDDVVRGVITFRGASRTARDASRGVNTQNMRRPPKGDMDALVEYLHTGSNELIGMVFGEPLDFLAQTVRAAITAPEGFKLAVSDLGSIESRCLGWLAGCKRMNQIFIDKKDTYKDFAQELFNVRYEDVTKDQRTFSKPPVLGAGYMMGGKGLAAYAENMGVDMTIDDAKHAVSVFRSTYPEILELWAWFNKAIEYVITSKQPTKGYNLTIFMQGEFLFIQLPSGRSIAYHHPLWQKVVVGSGEDAFETMSFTYMGINRFNMKWERINAHAGGVTENVIQAIARDVLMVWVDRLPNLDIRLRVHDELVAVVPEYAAEFELNRMNTVIAEPIDWAPGLLLTAEGEVVKHYGK